MNSSPPCDPHQLRLFYLSKLKKRSLIGTNHQPPEKKPKIEWTDLDIEGLQLYCKRLTLQHRQCGMLLQELKRKHFNTHSSSSKTKQSEEKDMPQPLTDSDNDADLCTEEDPASQEYCEQIWNEHILTLAFEKPEHSSGVWGVGSLVITPTAYFNHVKGMEMGMGNVVQEMKLEFRKQMADMNAKILELQQQVMKKDTGDNGSCSIKNQDVNPDNVEEVVADNVLSVVKLHKNKAKRHPVQPVNSKTTELPRSLKLLYMSARHELKDGLGIKIPLDGDVFGHEQINYIFFDDIQNICELKPIAASCICTYIWLLYEKCKNADLLDRFRFVNPYEVSHNPNVDQTQKSSITGKRLIGTLDKQLVLMPCNVGFHWILMVIDPHIETVYVLDSLSHDSHVEEWKSIMEMALKMFNMSIGKRGRHSPLWEMIKCQQQPDGKQCGFYVMRYMKDIIENYGSDNTLPIPSLFSEGFYSEKKIDEVRIEWAELVADFMIVDGL